MTCLSLVCLHCVQAEEVRSDGYELRVSLFDTNLHRFFGRTWKSEPHQATKGNEEQPRKVHFNEVGDLSSLQVVAHYLGE